MPGWHRPQDGAAPSQPPVQGCDHPQGSSSSSAPQTNPQLQVQTSFDHSPSTPPPASPATRRKDHPFNAEPGSPTKHRSPLRHSVSYTDPPELSSSSSASCDSLDSPQTLPLGSPIMSFTGDKKLTGSTNDASKARRPTWFSRGSTPPAVGYTQGNAPSTENTPVRRQRSQTSQESTPQNTPSSAGAFSFITSSMSAFKGRTSATAAPTQDDELLNLDIQAALFPHGPPSDRDTFSPAAFKNLQMTAMGLLQRYQTAYQQRTVALKDAKAERETDTESKDEADMRAHHLKLQLEEMARKATEQESIMQALMEELNKEKKLRMEERQARGKGDVTPDGSTTSEDMGVEEDQRTKWRKSGESFDTDVYGTEVASVFSRSRSPTIAASVSDVSTNDGPISQPKPATLEPVTPQKTPQQPMNALQKLLRGMSNDSSKSDTSQGGVDVCRNCQGYDASMAWDTVHLLQDENRGLKQRVGELEVAVEGALDAVNGLVL